MALHDIKFTPYILTSALKIDLSQGYNYKIIITQAVISISVVYFCFLCIDRYVKIKDLILLLINQLTLLDCPKSCRQFSFEWKLEKLEASYGK